MYEKRLRELSKKIGGESKRKFFILTHTKHKREIYFRNGREEIKFLRDKLHNSKGKFSFFKKIIWILLSLGILQLFLKKIKISNKFGGVIYVANQIKSFDLERERLTSFPLYDSQKENFIDSKEFQGEMSKMGFAPRIIEMNKDIPFVVEDILKTYSGGRDLEVLFKLMKFYSFMGIKKGGDGLLRTKIHGDFFRDNILIDKNGEILFIDWNMREGFIFDDLIKYFRLKL